MKRRLRASSPTRITYIHERTDASPWVAVIGETRKGMDIQRIIAGAQDVQSALMLPSPRPGVARPCGVQGRHGTRGVCVRAMFLLTYCLPEPRHPQGHG